MIKKTIILFLLLISTVYALDLLFHFGLSHNLNLKATYVTQGNKQNQVLVEGPCEPLFTMDPAYLQPKTGKKIYNLSLNHSDYADNYLHIYLYMKNNPAPEYLLLYATPESFDLRFNTFHPYRFVSFLSDSAVQSTIQDNDEDYASIMHIPLLRYSYFGSQLIFPALQGIKHWTGGKKEPYFVNGHQPHKSRGKEAGSLIFDVQLDEYGNRPEDATNKVFVWDINREKYFRKILDLAQKNGTKTIVYESPGYTEIFATQVNRKEVLQKIQTIAHEYKAPYWVFDHLPIGVEKENFICPLIMNSAASKQFMDTLAVRINKLQ